MFLSVLPTMDYDTFLTFPYKNSAKRINNATIGITILDHPFFKIQNNGEELRGMKFADMDNMERNQ